MSEYLEEILSAVRYIGVRYLLFSAIIILLLEISIRRKGGKTQNYWWVMGLAMFTAISIACYYLQTLDTYHFAVDVLNWDIDWFTGIKYVLIPGCLMFLGVYLLSQIYDWKVKLPLVVRILAAVILILGIPLEVSMEYRYSFFSHSYGSGSLLESLTSFPLPGDYNVIYVLRLIPAALYAFWLIRYGSSRNE